MFRHFVARYESSYTFNIMLRQFVLITEPLYCIMIELVEVYTPPAPAVAPATPRMGLEIASATFIASGIAR